MKHRTLLLIALTLFWVVSDVASAVSQYSAGKWDEDTIATFEKLPILDGGRVKPLDTVAQFAMLRINGKRSYIPLKEDGTEAERSEKLSPVEWMLDCLFYPEIAKSYPIFIIDNADMVTTIGAERHENQRDRYSYNELLPAREELFRRAQEAAAIDRTERSYEQSMMLSLAESMFEFEGLVHYFDFTKEPFVISGSAILSEKVFPGETDITLSRALEKGSDLRNAIAALRQVSQENGAEQFQGEIDGFEAFFRPMDIAGATAKALLLIPPVDVENKEWYSPAGMVESMFSVTLDAAEIAMLGYLEGMARTTDNPLAFKQSLAAFSKLSVETTTARGEYSKVPMEVSYYKSKILVYTQYLFVLSFIIAALLWLRPNNIWLTRATVISVVIPCVLLTLAIVIRSVIRSRPPVSTLYETILFIAAVAVIVALFIEWVNRQRIALSVAAFLGALGLFLASRYEILNQQDTMPSLVAVLDTNFWLATHVTIINIGYAAGMLAAGISHVYILGRLFNWRKDNPAFYRGMTRMVYGVTCFGLLFAFIGTVLGGIWANYSWGRFWGWDPKENGAALICVCQLAMLHARMGGYIKQMGFHIAALFTGCVIGFSWWGVNLLGVGLHSYGFTEGIWTATYIFWGTQGFVMVVGFFVLLRDKLVAAPSPPADAAPVAK